MFRSIVTAKSIVSLRAALIPRTFINSYSQIVKRRANIPPPTASVPDVQTFLKKIGRNAEEHVEVFESWENLFTMSSDELKEKGVDTRIRRYFLAWRERFRKGEELKEFKRGTKKYGGERKRRLVLSQMKNQENMRLRALRKKWLENHPEDAL